MTRDETMRRRRKHLLVLVALIVVVALGRFFGWLPEPPAVLAQQGIRDSAMCVWKPGHYFLHATRRANDARGVSIEPDPGQVTRT
jgi:hypothetical protein